MPETQYSWFAATSTSGHNNFGEPIAGAKVTIPLGISCQRIIVSGGFQWSEESHQTAPAQPSLPAAFRYEYAVTTNDGTGPDTIAHIREGMMERQAGFSLSSDEILSIGWWSTAAGALDYDAQNRFGAAGQGANVNVLFHARGFPVPGSGFYYWGSTPIWGRILLRVLVSFPAF